VQETVEQVRRIEVDRYKYGFETLIESEKAPRALSDIAVSAGEVHASRDGSAEVDIWRSRS
jgi:hypothetical protein